MSDKVKLGKTGEFPDGKAFEGDEGAIMMGVTNTDGLVFINFGTDVNVLAIPPKQAMELAQTLIEHARVAAKQSGDVLTLNL